MQKKNLNWIKFNRWTVIWEWQQLITQKKNWKPQPIRLLLCKCECWTIKEIRQWNLVNWSSKSCGCHHKEVCRELIKELHKTQTWSWNPNWKWWIAYHNSKEKSEIRRSYSYKQWAQLVKVNAWWKCVKCNWNKFLQAHHIQNFSEFPQLRFDDNNWICLCKICHDAFHFIYWKKQNNKTQINEFIY